MGAGVEERERAEMVRDLCGMETEARGRSLQAFSKMDLAEAGEILSAIWNENTNASSRAVLDALSIRGDAGKAEPFDVHWKRLSAQEDSALRLEALDAAGRLSGPDGARIVSHWVGDAESNIRMRAFTRLLVLNQPANASAAKGLADADASVRIQAIRLSARFPHPDCVPGLLDAAQSAEPRSVAAALDALKRHHSLLALVAAYRIQNGGVPELALEALKILQPLPGAAFPRAVAEGIESYPPDWPPPDTAGLAPVLERLPERTRDRYAKSLAPHWLLPSLVVCEAAQPAGSTGAVQRLVRISHDAEPSLRAAAVEALERHDAAEPGAVLSLLLTHPQMDVRRLAIQGLGRAGPKALALLRRFFSDENASLRRATYEALAELLPDECVSAWSRASRDADSSIRLWAVEKLVALPDGDEPRRALVKAARDADRQVRSAAVKALIEREIVLPSLAKEYRDTLVDALAEAHEGRNARFQPPELAALAGAIALLTPYNYMTALVQAAKHRSAVVRRSAAEAILSHQGTRQAREAMAMLSSTDDPDILKRVALTLANNGDPRGMIPLLRALDECPGSREALEPFLAHYPQVRQLRFLLRALKQPWPSIKRFALRGLLELDSPEMIEPLLQATKDPDPDVQRGALQALARFSKHPQVYKRLMEIRDAGGNENLRQEAVATLLGMDSPSVIQPLLEATREDDVEVQLGAVQALGRFASKAEVVARLLELIEYGDVAVREKAIQVLGENKVKQAVETLIRFISNPFLGGRAQEALFAIGDRKGILAIKRFKLRARLFGKKKSKGLIKSIGVRNKLRPGPAKARGRHI